MRNPLKRPGSPGPAAPAAGPTLQLVGSAPTPPAPDPVTPTAPAGVGAESREEHAPAERVLAERHRRRAELAERRALRRAEDAEAAVREASARLDRLEHELGEGRRETGRLREKLLRVERARREAEQLAHSESAIRLERERDHAARIRRHQADASSVLELLEAVQIRVRRLSGEVEALRRAAAQAGERGRDRPAVADIRRTSPVPDGWAAVLAAELIIARSAPSAAFTASSVVRPPVRPPGVTERPVPQAARRATRRDGERADLPAQPAPAVAPDRLAAALYRLRAESPLPQRGPPGPSPAPSRAWQSRAVVEPAAAAFRAATAPTPTAPAPELADAACWLRPALKRAVREDPEIAGSIVIELLPAQRLVAGPVRYDVALTDAGCLAVTVVDGAVRVERLGEPRPLEEVGFRVEGDLAGLGRLLVYGALRRRLSRRVAAVRGDREALHALRALVLEPLALRELEAAGVRFDPWLTLKLVACMIDPGWTDGARFTLGHESRGGAGRAYLLVRDGAPLRVSRYPPLGPVASTILCPDEQLLALLAGGSAPEATVLGATGPLTLLREWIVRAERGA